MVNPETVETRTMTAQNRRLEELEKTTKDLSANMGGVQLAVDSLQSTVSGIESSVGEIVAQLKVLTAGKPPVSGEPLPTQPPKPTNPAVLMPRMELPGFDGTDPIAWLAQAEKYFIVHSTPPDQRVATALIAMSGKAMFWAQWLLRRDAAIEWTEFSQEVIARLGDSLAINAYEAKYLTRQTGTKKMEEKIEKGVESDSFLARFDRIRLGKVKFHDYNNTTTFPVLHHQDNAKAATPLPLPPLPTLPSVSTITQALPPALETTQELLPPVTMETESSQKPRQPPPPVIVAMPTSLVDVCAVFLMVFLPPDLTVSISFPARAFPLARVVSFLAKELAPARIDASSPLPDWKELIGDFCSTTILNRKDANGFEINMQGKHGFIGPYSLKSWQNWDVF